MNNDKTTPPTSNFESDFNEAYQRQQEENEVRLQQKIEEATKNGKQEFDANVVFEAYYPNDWSNDENLIMKRAESFRKDYYNSDAHTIKEWVEAKENIEQQGDS
ncbi:MAG: hypothetical protein WCO19_04925 [Candidatus Saccharibacteria bacterium]